jgi:hypothetical protein
MDIGVRAWLWSLQRAGEAVPGFLANTALADGYKEYESILNDYYDEMTPITTIKPYMVGPGNRESNCDYGSYTDTTKYITYNVSICMPSETNFTGYVNRFRMPQMNLATLGTFGIPSIMAWRTIFSWTWKLTLVMATLAMMRSGQVKSTLQAPLIHS